MRVLHHGDVLELDRESQEVEVEPAHRDRVADQGRVDLLFEVAAERLVDPSDHRLCGDAEDDQQRHDADEPGMPKSHPRARRRALVVKLHGVLSHCRAR